MLRHIKFLVPVLFGTSLFIACNRGNKQADDIVGHNGSPLLSFLYAVADSENNQFRAVKFNSSSDIGYALLSGSIDAGFIEPERIDQLRHLKGYENLVAVGKVTFPFGLTLIIPKESTIRLNELSDKVVAVVADKQGFVPVFKSELERFDIIPDSIKFVPMPFDAVIPALESGVIDGALVKGSQAIVAQRAGHNVLYQKWDMEPGNECCPPVISQLEFILLSRKDNIKLVEKLVVSFKNASEGSPEILREATIEALNLPQAYFSDMPLASFSEADSSLPGLFSEHYGELCRQNLWGTTNTAVAHTDDEHDEHKEQHAHKP